jgi:ATP-dependent Clp protease ATP-binding subunit ClpC
VIIFQLEAAVYNLSKRARHVLDYFAQSEGKRLRSDSLGPEHIFLGLLRDGDSSAMKILRSLGLNFDVLRRNIEQGLRTGGSAPVHFGTIPQNSRFIKVIDGASEEARKLGSVFIGTEHLLLAVFREGLSSAIEGLTSAGIDYNVIHDEIARNAESQDQDGQVKPKSRQSALDEFGADLSRMAREGLLEPVIGRDAEIERMIHILSRKSKNNPVLVGDAGVGKTAVAEGLAERIVEGKVPSFLAGKRVVSLDMPSIVAGTKFRGDFEDRMKKIIRELKSDRNVILFIDEMHTLLGAGAAEGAIDAANIIKPALARGEIQCIGATTLKEYRRYVEKDPALERRFQKILIEEPSTGDCIEIIRGIIHRYEEYHKVTYSDDAVVDAVRLSKRYISDRFLPDKAIDCIDEAGSMAKISGENMPEEISELQKEIQKLESEKNRCVESQEFEKAASVRDRLNTLRNEFSAVFDKWKKREGEYSIVVDGSVIRDVIERWTGVKISDSAAEDARYLNVEKELSKRIIGQESAVSSIARVLRRARAGIRSGKRPVSSFLFVGPTGVGKTESAKAIAESIFGSADSLIRIDMSEYMEKHTVARLIGSPPGYVGYEDGGQLTEKIRKKPFSIVLFDEIEKAHHDFFNILLQIFDEGELTDGNGRTVSFRDTMIVMTSNIGNTRFDTTGSIGFSEESAKMNEHGRIYAEIRKSFNPEFINRIDEIVYFESLDRGHIAKIIDLQVRELQNRLADRHIKLSVTDEVKAHLLEKGFSQESGARRIRRLIEAEIEDEVALMMLSDKQPGTVCAVMSGGKISVRRDSSPEKSRETAAAARSNEG